MENKEVLIREIKKEISKLPKGNINYKTINDKQQPYLQWTESGKTHSIYIKINEREQIIADVEKRKRLEKKLEHLMIYSIRISEIMEKNPTINGMPCIGSEVFADYIRPGIMYVDKTEFIKRWWESNDKVTLITRPRRFGKSLMLSTVEHFFSVRFNNQLNLFKDLFIFSQKEYADIAGTYPVIRLNFGMYKTGDVNNFKIGVANAIAELYEEYRGYIKWNTIDNYLKDKYETFIVNLRQGEFNYLIESLRFLCKTLFLNFGIKPIILLDEYDTPIQEAYMHDMWDEIASLYRSFIFASFKANEYFERTILTGITCISKESFFSDMNNIVIDTVTSDRYADLFGFTEEEVFDALDCHDGMEKQKVKEMYDGFTFGKINNIYNPWSIVNYMRERKFKGYWISSGGNGLASRVILRGENEVKDDIHKLMNGESIHKKFSETITYNRLEYEQQSLWALLLCSGCLTASNVLCDCDEIECDLRITNKETWYAFADMVNQWNYKVGSDRSDFCKYLIANDVEMMNVYMNSITQSMISMFDVGTKPSQKAPERFYYGFVLGLLVELKDKYIIESNRESGYGRYDIMMIPRSKEYNGIIIEFKVHDSKQETNLGDTARNALKQINSMNYEKRLIESGVIKDKIKKYGFAFEGKDVLII